MVVAAIAVLWALFAIQAGQSTTLLDDWVQLAWYRGRGLDLDLVWQVARYNYLHGNPRIGDVFLLLVDGPRAIHLVVTPLVQLLLLGAAFTVALGRRPVLRYRDLELALFLQVMIWLASPIPGAVYFYRPFATNYLFAFTAMLCWFAPYRLALARAPRSGERWWPLPMLALGWLAGMGNEHTGPAAIAAAAICLAQAWRRRRLRAWMIAGALGLCAGYLMLMLAPGQAERYAGRAGRFDALGLVASRGVAGNYEIVAGFVGEAQWAIDLVIAAVLGFVAWHRRTGGPAPAMPRSSLRAIAGLLAAAGAILVALFASPVAIERLLFASAVLLAGALLVVADHVFTLPRLRALITSACAVIFAYHAVRFVQVHAAAAAEDRQRIAQLRAAPPGTIATVPPYRTPRSRWYWGDDFRMAGVREYVAHEVFDLAGIELAPRPIWAEPTPAEHFVAGRVYDPPLPPGLAAVAPRPRDVPSFLDAALDQLRRALALGWWSIPGHRLVGYEIDAASAEFADPAHRRLHVLAWTPAAVAFVYGDGDEDRDGQPVIRVSAPTLPAGWTDAFVVGCGRTTRVEPRRGDGERELILPVDLACRGSYTAVICDPGACWFAGRYWR